MIHNSIVIRKFKIITYPRNDVNQRKKKPAKLNSFVIHRRHLTSIMLTIIYISEDSEWFQEHQCCPIRVNRRRRTETKEQIIKTLIVFGYTELFYFLSMVSEKLISMFTFMFLCVRVCVCIQVSFNFFLKTTPNWQFFFFSKTKKKINKTEKSKNDASEETRYIL